MSVFLTGMYYYYVRLKIDQTRGGDIIENGNSPPGQYKTDDVRDRYSPYNLTWQSAPWRYAHAMDWQALSDGADLRRLRLIV